jgi:hypothetical protein
VNALRLNPRYVFDKSEKDEVQCRQGGRIRSTTGVLLIVRAEVGPSSHDPSIIHDCLVLSMSIVTFFVMSASARKLA